MTFDFPTAYGRMIAHKRIHTEPGSRIHIEYAPRFDEDGIMRLVEVGRKNIYNMIQSHRDSVDINLIVKRYQLGDETALGDRNGTFFDATQMPRNYADMLNMLNEAHEAFDALPLDVRRQFDFDFNQFLVSGGMVPADEPAAAVAEPVSTEVIEDGTK